MDRFTMNPDPAEAGKKLTICFTNSSLAGQTITVTLHNGLAPGSPGYQSTTVQISLNGEGYGCVEWTVPATGWDGVTGTHPTSEDHSIPVI